MKKSLSLIALSLISLASLSATEEGVNTSPFYSKGYMSTELSKESGKIESKHILNTSFGHKNQSTYSELGLTLDARIKNDQTYLYSVLRELSVPKFIFGVNILENEDTHLSVELSRKPLQEIFDSKILFFTTVPGIHVKYSMERPEGRLIVKQGFFRDYISITELSLEEINQTGAYAKFSLNVGMSTMKIFQSLFGYKRSIFNMPLNAYIAGIWITDKHFKPIDSGYLGCKIGNAKAAKDWSVDLYARALKTPDREYGVFSTITYLVKDNLCLTQEQSWMKPFKMTYKIKHSF